MAKDVKSELPCKDLRMYQVGDALTTAIRLCTEAQAFWKWKHQQDSSSTRYRHDSKVDLITGRLQKQVLLVP